MSSETWLSLLVIVSGYATFITHAIIIIKCKDDRFLNLLRGLSAFWLATVFLINFGYPVPPIAGRPAVVAVLGTMMGSAIYAYRSRHTGVANVIDWSALAAFGMFLLAVYIGVKKAPHENRNLDSEYINSILTSSNSIAARNVELQKTIENHEKRIKDLEAGQASDQIKILKVEDHNRRLIAQLESMGYIPVPFDPYSTQPRQRPSE